MALCKLVFYLFSMQSCFSKNGSLQNSSVVFSMYDNFTSRLWFHHFLFQSQCMIILLQDYGFIIFFFNQLYAVQGRGQDIIPKLH